MEKDAKERRFCRKCSDHSPEASVAAELESFLQLMKPEERSGDAEMERRLAICRSCVFLQKNTCGVCGCYVEFRAAARYAVCPKKKWKR